MKSEKITAELIIENCNNDANKIVLALNDCFTSIRIESKLGALSRTAPFNQGSRDEMSMQYEHLDMIKKKYGIPI